MSADAPRLVGDLRDFGGQRGGVELMRKYDDLVERARVFREKAGAAYGNMRVSQADDLSAELAALRREFDDLKSSERGADAVKATMGLGGDASETTGGSIGGGDFSPEKTAKVRRQERLGGAWKSLGPELHASDRRRHSSDHQERLNAIKERYGSLEMKAMDAGEAISDGEVETIVREVARLREEFDAVVRDEQEEMERHLESLCEHGLRPGNCAQCKKPGFFARLFGKKG